MRQRSGEEVDDAHATTISSATRSALHNAVVLSLKPTIPTSDFLFVHFLCTLPVSSAFPRSLIAVSTLHSFGLALQNKHESTETSSDGRRHGRWHGKCHGQHGGCSLTILEATYCWYVKPHEFMLQVLIISRQLLAADICVDFGRTCHSFPE